jgi:hypothetical protein
MNPKARQSDVIVQDVGLDTLVYDERKDTAHSLGRVAAYVFKHADGSLPVAALATGMHEALNLPAEPQLVEAALWELERADLLESSDPARRHINRRQALQRFGAALSAVAITTIVAPTPAMARSYGGIGGPKGNGKGNGKGKGNGNGKGKGKGVAKKNGLPPGLAKKG